MTPKHKPKGLANQKLTKYVTHLSSL